MGNTEDSAEEGVSFMLDRKAQGSSGSNLCEVARIRSCLASLIAYCEKNEWTGFDPYDALNSRLFNLTPLANSKLCRIAITQILKRLPVNLRTLLLVSREQNPKALSLFLMAFIKLSKLGVYEEDGLIEGLLERLVALRSPHSHYWCWGYSFPWQTRTLLVPRWSPNLVCTAFVSNALLDAYEVTHEARYLRMAISAGDYVLNDLYWTEGDSIASFRYPSPAMQANVHNANFLGAALLCRIYKQTNDKKFLDPALRVARYSAGGQHDDGSWDYGESPTQRWVDNFHTGYNLCALRSIARYTGTSEFESNLCLGFRFYREHFFREDGAPRYFHNRTYPIDIHSVAQSITTLLELKDLDESSVQLAYSVLKWALNEMWDTRGYFYYQILPWYRNRISYMRWSQAWMLLALATFLEGYGLAEWKGSEDGRG
jgi:hypothetical protein